MGVRSGGGTSKGVQVSMMLALSPHLFSTNMAWPLEDNVVLDLQYENILASCTPAKEAEASSQSLGFSSTFPELDFEDQQCPNPTTKEYCLNKTKKLSHNAYERDRRKKMNELYSSLRSLLPDTDQTKKLSIPCTVSRVLRYIPELQRHIERLIRKREEILQRASTREGESGNRVHESRGQVYPTVSVTSLNNSELMIHICLFSNTTNKFLSRVLRILDDEGLQLLSASTLSTHGDRTFYSLHLKEKQPLGVESSIYFKHLTEVIRQQASIG